MQSPDKNIHEQLFQAIELIESSLSSKTYMTRLRIVEILGLKNVSQKNNFYLSNQNALLFLLLGLQQSGNIQMTQGHHIYRSELYEESEHEPVLYDDIPEGQARTFFNEIAFGRGLHKGMSYNQINSELIQHNSSSVLKWINILKQEGVTPHNVFYKRVDIPKDKQLTILPALPVTID